MRKKLLIVGILLVSVIALLFFLKKQNVTLVWVPQYSKTHKVFFRIPGNWEYSNPITERIDYMIYLYMWENEEQKNVNSTGNVQPPYTIHVSVEENYLNYSITEANLISIPAVLKKYALTKVNNITVKGLRGIEYDRSISPSRTIRETILFKEDGSVLIRVTYFSTASEAERLKYIGVYNAIVSSVRDTKKTD